MRPSTLQKLLRLLKRFQRSPGSITLEPDRTVTITGPLVEIIPILARCSKVSAEQYFNNLLRDACTRIMEEQAKKEQSGTQTA